MSLASPYAYPRPISEHGKSLRRKDSDPFAFTQDEFAATKPKMSSQPYVKLFNESRSFPHLAIANPLEEILQCSRKQILSYELKLPFSTSSQGSNSLPTSQSDHPSIPSDITSKIYLRDAIDCEKTQKLSNADELQVPSFLMGPEQKQTTQTVQSKDLRDITDNDPLACHANNIMRMAMDTTMMGSFCNSSISLNFLNLDESMHKFAEGSERSRNGQKKGALLNLQKAAKIEISAADLEDAINNPIR